jgi:hypothetical protein
MPSWGNTDNVAAKPKWDVERQLREVVQLVTANTTNAGNTVVTFTYNDGAQNQVSNVGIVAGQSVFVLYNGANGTSYGANGVPGFFNSNVTVVSTSGNNVVLSQGVFSTLGAGLTIEFDKNIAYNPNKNTAYYYNADTIMVTPTRMANATVTFGNIQPGWVHINRKVNNDGTVRYLKETLVALANTSAANTNSANTSWGQAFTGV